MLFSVILCFRISQNSSAFPFAVSIFLCNAVIFFGQYFSFCFGFSQVMSVMMNLSVKGGNLTLCITSLNFLEFSTNRSMWKTLYLSRPSERSLIKKGCKINHQLNEFHEKRVSILQPRFPFVVFRLFHLDIYWPFVLLAQVLYQEKHY